MAIWEIALSKKKRSANSKVKAQHTNLWVCILWMWKWVVRGEKPRIALRGLLALITCGGDMVVRYGSCVYTSSKLGAIYVNPCEKICIIAQKTLICICNRFFSRIQGKCQLTWNTLFADSLKVLSIGVSIGMAAVNFLSNCETSSSLVNLGLKGGSSFRDNTSSQMICSKNLCTFICSASDEPDPNRCKTCLCREVDYTILKRKILPLHLYRRIKIGSRVFQNATLLSQEY